MDVQQINQPNDFVGSDLDSFYNSERSRILVVEDDLDTSFLLKQILRHAGFDVLSAANGLEALSKINVGTPDLVLLDLMMPEMDGWETVDRLRQFSNTPVIILTALNHKEETVNCFQKGVDDYMTKPFYKAEVVANQQQGSLSRDILLPFNGRIHQHPERDLAQHLHSFSHHFPARVTDRVRCSFRHPGKTPVR